MKSKQCLDGICDCCGKKILLDGDVIDKIVVLRSHYDNPTFDSILGEWCSEKCFLKNMGKN